MFDIDTTLLQLLSTKKKKENKTHLEKKLAYHLIIFFRFVEHFLREHSGPSLPESGDPSTTDFHISNKICGSFLN